MNQSLFRSPPKAARPLVRWWWPGLDVQADELAREIAEMDAAGIGGAELQPFAIGLPADLGRTDPGRNARTHRFMQPYHYEMMLRVVEAARERGMTIDITQNSAWPTGGTHITLADSLQTLLISTTTVHGPRPSRTRIPAARPLRLYTFFGTVVPLVAKGMNMLEYVHEDKRLVAVVAGRCTEKPGEFSSWKAKRVTLLDLGSMVDLTGQVEASGVLKWDVPEGAWQVFAIYEGSAGAMALQDARSAAGQRALVVNHFDRAAEQRHLEAFFGEAHAWFGGDFGQTFRAFFTDSFELISPMHWTHSFVEEFRRRRGYDITPYLPAMYVPLKDVGYYTYGNEVGLPNFDFAEDAAASHAGSRMRYDFQRTLSELFIEQFIQGMADWAHMHGLSSRVQGYGMLADPLAMLGYSDIPETEQLYGGGALNFLKLAGAAGTLYERPVVTAETLVWQGRAYMTTPLKWRVGLDRLYEAGVNQAIYHGFPYHHPGFVYPGYHPFASAGQPMMTFSSDMSRNDPLLAGVAADLNGYAARAQYILQRSRTNTRVGIFYQRFDYPNGNFIEEELVGGVLDEWDAPAPQGNRIADMIMPSGTDVTGDRKWIQDTAALATTLVSHGHYPIYFNEDRLLRARVEGRAVVMGEARFEALILYHESSLTVEAAMKLAEIAEAGIPVLFVGRVPDRSPGWHDHAARDAAVRAEMGAIANPMGAIGLPMGAIANPMGAIGSPMAGGGSVCAGAEDVLVALAAAGVRPEVSYDEPQAHVGFIHKIDREDGAEYFWLRNRTRAERTVTLTLPGRDRIPVLLDLWTGGMGTLPYEPGNAGAVPAALREQPGQRQSPHPERVDEPTLPTAQGQSKDAPTPGLRVTLGLAGFESAVVMLADPATAAGLPPAPERFLLADLEPVLSIGGFLLTAEQRLVNGARRHVELHLPELRNWLDVEELENLGDPGEYTTTFHMDGLEPGRRYFLQLDRVCDRADVVLNGQALAPLFVLPWRREITGLLAAGSNDLKITVTPTLRNQLVGYADSGGKDYRQYKKGARMPAGLIGKVQVCAVR